MTNMAWPLARDSEPLEKTISTKRKSLQDLKPLLEDRGGIKTRNENVRNSGRNPDGDFSNNSVYDVGNKVSFATVSVRNTLRCQSRFRFSGRCFRFKTIVFVVCVIFSEARLFAEARSSGES